MSDGYGEPWPTVATLPKLVASETGIGVGFENVVAVVLTGIDFAAGAGAVRAAWRGATADRADAGPATAARPRPRSNAVSARSLAFRASNTSMFPPRVGVASVAF